MAAVPPSRIADRRAIAPQRLADDVGVSQPPASLPPPALIRISYSPPSRRSPRYNPSKNNNKCPNLIVSSEIRMNCCAMATPAGGWLSRPTASESQLVINPKTAKASRPCSGGADDTPHRCRLRSVLGFVRFTVKPVVEPDAGNPHVRFDEQGWETERCRMAQATAPILDSTTAALIRCGAKVRTRSEVQRTWGERAGCGDATRLTRTGSGVCIAAIEDDCLIFYSITSSARTRIAGEMVTPIASAVFMLRINSNLVGCSTGRSATFAPFAIVSINSAARRYMAGKFTPQENKPPASIHSRKP